MTSHAGVSAALAASAEDLVTRILAEQYRDPFWLARYGERAERRGREDGHFHLTYVAQALAEDDANVMVAYARWLQGLLCTRGMCSRHLAENFDRLAHAIADLEDVDPTPAIAMLGAAVEALRYPDGPGRAAQDLAPVAIAEAVPVLVGQFPAATRRVVDDVTTLVDYAADAVALGGSATFDAHAAWLPDFLATQGVPAGYPAALIAAVRGRYFT